MGENLPQHLAVAHLHESYFYDPVLTIKLFCHEAAHYLSDRHRKERAKYIFRVVSFLLLANTPLGFVMEQKQDISLVTVMADSMADFLMEMFDEYSLLPNRNISYHLKDISRFLDYINYGMYSFGDDFYAERICAGWRNILRETVLQEPAKFCEPFVCSLGCVQETLQSDYLVELFRQDPEGMHVYEVFSRIIAYHISFQNGLESNTEFFMICQNVLQAFSEAYADLRMSELTGEEFLPEDYNNLFKQVDVDSRFQMVLRHDAVLSVIKPKGNWTPLIPEEADQLILFYAVEQIRQYLELCHAQPTGSDYVIQILQDLKFGNISTQCTRIRETIQRYRMYLTQYCQRILNDYSPSIL